MIQFDSVVTYDQALPSAVQQVQCTLSKTVDIAPFEMPKATEVAFGRSLYSGKGID
jgi:hypothetical protein